VVGARLDASSRVDGRRQSPARSVACTCVSRRIEGRPRTNHCRSLLDNGPWRGRPYVFLRNTTRSECLRLQRRCHSIPTSFARASPLWNCRRDPLHRSCHSYPPPNSHYDTGRNGAQVAAPSRPKDPRAPTPAPAWPRLDASRVHYGTSAVDKTGLGLAASSTPRLQACLEVVEVVWRCSIEVWNAI